jgi:hypothetical protein
MDINREQTTTETLPTLEEYMAEQAEDIFKDIQLPDHYDNDNNPIEDPYIEKDKPGKLHCRVCGRTFKAITGNHLNTHDGMTLADYIEKYPKAPINYFGKMFPKKEDLPKHSYNKNTKPIEPEIVKDDDEAKSIIRPGTYLDKHGCLRDSKTKRLVKGTKALNVKGRPKDTTIEKFLRGQIGWNGEEVFKFLYAVVTYNHIKERHKTPWYKPSDQLKAAEMLLAYTFGRPKQRQEIQKTVKTLNVNIGQSLPKGITLEEFE